MEIETMPTTNLSDEAYDRKKKRNVAYISNNVTRITLNLNHNTDADILAYLQQADNKQKFLKDLIRSRMKEEGFVYGEEA